MDEFHLGDVDLACAMIWAREEALTPKRTVLGLRGVAKPLCAVSDKSTTANQMRLLLANPA